MATRWDDLHLEDAWLDVAPPANASGASAAPRITDGTQ
jgi:hypothetical protein